LAKILHVPNFCGGRIGPTCFNQNFADSHIRHKIYRQQNISHVNCARMDRHKHMIIFAAFRPLLNFVLVSTKRSVFSIVGALLAGFSTVSVCY